jgi:hypothetical protein
MLALCSAVFFAGCSADKSTGVDAQVAADAAKAEARLFEAMNKDDFAAAGDIVGELNDLRDRDPLNYRNTFIFAAANFWWIAEAARPDAGVDPLLIISLAVPNILSGFPDVIQNDPKNRYGAAALLGAFLSDAGFDKVSGSALVDSAAKYAPQIGIFQQMHIRRFAAADDSTTAQSIEYGFKWWEWCLGAPIDRNNPDFTGKVKPPTEGPFGFCWGSARVPHGFEGTWMIFGDLLVKGGKLAAARRAYANAQLGVNYSRWKHKDELEARLASDLAQRYATYASHDPANWAPIGNPSRGCTQCHASKQ